jgi:hypothetical protein
MAALERLVARGFHIVAFPLYASAIGIRRDDFAALLTHVDGGSLRFLGRPHYLIDGNLSVQVERAGVQRFVWKGKSVEATLELLARLHEFAESVNDALSEASQ